MKGAHLLLIVNTSTCFKNGAPPDKSGVLYRLLHIEFHGLTAESMF